MPDTFRVDHTKVVEESEGVWVPDMQARFEYKQHFGTFDFKDLCRRYRSAKLEAQRRSSAAFFAPKKGPSAVMRNAIRKRRLVQATLMDWKQPGTTTTAA